MTQDSTFNWENAKDIAEQVVFMNTGIHLTDIDIEVLKGAWEGLTYEQMTDRMSQRPENKKFYSIDYLRGDVGYKLFGQKLSQALGEPVSKTNFKTALERAWQKETNTTSLFKQFTKDKQKQPKLSYPEGLVPLNSQLYLERDRVESTCYQEIVKPGALIRIKAPNLMGKTSLVIRTLYHCQTQNHRTVYLDFGGTEHHIIEDLDKLLRWFCLMVSRQLAVDNRLADYWDTDILGSNDNCTVYFEEYILPEISVPLVIGLDDVDRIFSYPEVVGDFFGMLRNWHERGKISKIWKDLRLVMAHSTECYIPLDLNQSPFNAGIPIGLVEFNQEQVKTLVSSHSLHWDTDQIKNLMQLIGGHPYLTRLALYEVSVGTLTLEQLLDSAATEAGIYSNHLRRTLEALQKVPQLVEAYFQVVKSPEPMELSSSEIYKLHSMGLIHRHNNHVIPSCHLYRTYFSRVLAH